MSEEEMKAQITQAHIDGYNRGYAKAKEKIADIKANCDLAIEGRDVKIMELEKENAELKKKIGIYQKGMYDEIEKRDKKLTKAKEIIRTFLNMPMPNNEEVFADVGMFLTKAEQFLKEIK